MILSLARLQRIAATPFSSTTQSTRLVVDIADDSITLAAGVYTLTNDGDVTMWLCVGGAASVPADKAALAAGFSLPAGAVAQFFAPVEQVLHAIVASDTADLLVTAQGL